MDGRDRVAALQMARGRATLERLRIFLLRRARPRAPTRRRTSLRHRHPQREWQRAAVLRYPAGEIPHVSAGRALSPFRDTRVIPGVHQALMVEIPKFLVFAIL